MTLKTKKDWRNATKVMRNALKRHHREDDIDDAILKHGYYLGSQTYAKTKELLLTHNGPLTADVVFTAIKQAQAHLWQALPLPANQKPYGLANMLANRDVVPPMVHLPAQRHLVATPPKESIVKNPYLKGVKKEHPNGLFGTKKLRKRKHPLIVEVTQDVLNHGLEKYPPQTVFTAYKYSTADGGSAVKTCHMPHFVHKALATLLVEEANVDPEYDCGSGVNVGTLAWCVHNKGLAGYLQKDTLKLWLVAFTREDIACVPDNGESEGKFRLFRAEIVREMQWPRGS